MRSVVEGLWRDRRRQRQCQHKGKVTIARTVIVTTVIATTDTPMSPRVKCTDSHCPRTPKEVGTVIVPLSGWSIGQKDEMSQKNGATHQTQLRNCSSESPVTPLGHIRNEQESTVGILDGGGWVRVT